MIDDEKAPPARRALFSLNVLRSSSKVIPEEAPDCGTAIAAGTGAGAMRNSISCFTTCQLSTLILMLMKNE